MYDKYNKLNDIAKNQLLEILERKQLDKEELKRCKKEIDLLYEKCSLFLVQYLYFYKKNNKGVRYKFNGLENNLLLLYILGLSNVNPLDYNLPYEIFEKSNISTLYVEFINSSPLDFIKEIHLAQNSFRLYKGDFEKENDEELNDFLDNHYEIVSKCYLPEGLTFKKEERKADIEILSTGIDYRKLEKIYLFVKLTCKKPLLSKQVSINNALRTDFEKQLANILEPKEFNDYVKIISMSHGTNVWNDNQDEMFINGEIEITNIISSREDVYNYLIEHGIDAKTSLEIMSFIRRGKACSNKKVIIDKWNSYKKMMKEHNCDNYFIEVCSKIKYLSGKGQAVGECLYALDKNNYIKNNKHDII